MVLNIKIFGKMLSIQRALTQATHMYVHTHVARSREQHTLSQCVLCNIISGIDDTLKVCEILFEIYAE